MRTKSLPVTALVLTAPFASTGLASTYTWNSTNIGYWTTSAYWLRVGVPAEIDTVIVGKGTVNVSFDSLLALDDLHLYGGKIQGATDVRGLCEWPNGGVASGTNTVRSNAVLRLVTDATKTFAIVILDSAGVIPSPSATHPPPATSSSVCTNREPARQHRGWQNQEPATRSFPGWTQLVRPHHSSQDDSASFVFAAAGSSHQRSRSSIEPQTATDL